MADGSARRRTPGVVAALVAIAAALAAVTVLLRTSPWPSALAVRWAFERGARRTSAALRPLVPDGVTARLGEAVDAGPGIPAAHVDVVHPTALADGERLPTVVWVHGGAWVSGSTRDVAEYARILAARGFTVVTVGYAVAPRQRYPVPVHQVCAALRHVVAHADGYHVDPARLALAGDSAGAQIAAQVAALVTDPAYARRVGVVPPVGPEGLRAAVLLCGAYDVARVDGSGLRGWFLRTVLWSYSGTRHFATDPVIGLASVRDHVTARFPPAFVSAGNADPLLPHSRDLVERLGALGVPVDALFFADDHEPPLGHEYQFRLDTAAGREALERVVAFLGEHLTSRAG
ncbi:alpha/beta hydrolase [Cellulomonas cellasea]|uniref:Acetyl esterase/lipase n=1 Tax=Cellulomonas cellasea TaxID=43670 RepID=A0A7W4UI59_9CELL|nr:alpha/beta hydrolase [Cellulomonas cellasea]MBB2924616.1 acetyl esterase/lipase [Cellulomonas cellasea]